jgi:hypothetical protein
VVKALEVSIKGKIVGIYVPAKGHTFCAMIANVPKSYMRAQVISGSDSENWYWQLPDIKEGQVISFKMIEATADDGVPPQRVVEKDPEAVNENKLQAKKLYKKAMRMRKRGER